MADNFETNAGSGGAEFASTEVSGVQHPKVKVEYGGSGAAQEVDATHPLPIVPRTPNGDSVCDDTNDAVKVVNATAANLKAELGASSAIVGQVGIDQTTPGTTNAVYVTTAPVRARTTDHIGAALCTDALMNGLTALTPTFVNIDTATSGDNTLVAAVSGKTHRLLGLALFAGGAVDVYIHDGTANLLGGTRKINLDNSGAAGSPCVILPFSPVGWAKCGDANRAIVLNLSAAVGVCGVLIYVSE